MASDLGNLIKTHFRAKAALYEAQQKVQQTSSELLRQAVVNQVFDILKIDEAALHRYIKREE